MEVNNEIVEIKELIITTNEYLLNIIAGCERISDNFRSEQISEALEEVLPFTDGANWLVQGYTLLIKHNVEISLPVNKIIDILNELNNALEIRDYVFVADLFEYELQPIFTEYKQSVEVVLGE